MRKALPRLRLYGFVRFVRFSVTAKYTYKHIQKRSANLTVSRAFYCVSIKPQLI